MNRENAITGPLVLPVLRNLLRRIKSAKGKQRAVGAPFGVARITKEFCFALLAASFTFHPTAWADGAASLSTLSHLLVAKPGSAAPSTIESHPVESRVKRAHFGLARPSLMSQHMADWVMDTGDNGSKPFAIVDKKDAQVFVFYADGRLRGTAPVLLGLAVGDEATPGIGNRPLSNIRPDERTTPAGRFVASMDLNLKGKEILWVDYDGAVSMHPVVTSKPKERRLQRLNSPTPLDNRISYGCINVPPQFFKDVVHPAFTGTEGIVYVLPDTKSLKDVFTAYKEANSKQNEHKN